MKTIKFTDIGTSYDTYNFKGIILPCDFFTDYPRNTKTPSWADRIASDWAFDKQCRKNAENRDNKRKDFENGDD